MKKQILYKSAIVCTALFVGACDFLKDEETEQEQLINYTNTLAQNLGGTQGAVADYFYNFESNVDASYFRYNPNLMANYESYLDYYNLFGQDPTIMSFRTFPNHLVSMTSADEAEFTQRNYIDSLSVADSIVSDSVLMTSTPFKNLERLEWNLEAEPSLQRYKLINSDWVVSDTMLYYSDTFDVSAYWAIVDTPFIESGLLFVDSSEWNDTDYVFISDDPIRFLNTFEFVKQQLSDDSLVFRMNTDCNDNGRWDDSELTGVDYNGNGIYELLYEYSDNNNNGVYDAGDDIIQDYDSNDTISIAYEFIDRGNGIWDPHEPYYDIDSSGTYDLNEPYQDRNCNNKWDDAEAYSDDDGSGNYSDGDSFVDSGNNVYDASEEYRLKDLNSDGVLDTLLYLTGDKPDNLIVDWTDSDSPEVMLNLQLGDDVTDRWGNVYTDIIEEIESDSSLKDVSRIEDILDYYRVSNMSDNDTRVKVMTIHKAKGLEFDHVIIPFLARKPHHNDKTLINWIDHKTDKNDLIISPIGTDDEDLLYNYINDYIKDANENEILRLIYVGFTRACKSLDIIGNVKLIEENDNRVIKVPSKQSFLYKIWPAFNESFERNKNINKPPSMINIVYGKICLAFNSVIPRRGKAQNGCSIFVN